MSPSILRSKKRPAGEDPVSRRRAGALWSRRPLGLLPRAAPRDALVLQHLQGKLTERMPRNNLGPGSRRRSPRRLDQLARVSDERGRDHADLPLARDAPGERACRRLDGGRRALPSGRTPWATSSGGWARRRAGRRTLLLGSHLDTVRDAGRFDGALGVLLPDRRPRGASRPGHRASRSPSRSWVSPRRRASGSPAPTWAARATRAASGNPTFVCGTPRESRSAEALSRHNRGRLAPARRGAFAGRAPGLCRGPHRAGSRPRGPRAGRGRRPRDRRPDPGEDHLCGPWRAMRARRRWRCAATPSPGAAEFILAAESYARRRHPAGRDRGPHLGPSRAPRT